MTRKFGVLALALTLGLFVAACGGGSSGGSAGGDRLSKDDYLTKVNAVGEKMRAIGEKMSATMQALGDTPSDPEAGAKQFEDLSTALKGAADDLAALNPPEEVEDAHKKFTEGVSMLADDIGKAGEGMSGGDMSEAMSFVSTLASSDAMKKLREAADELEKAGYNVV